MKESHTFSGWCGLKYRPELEEVDLGYRFMQKYWGMGFATETARATLDHGLQTLKLPLITGRAHVENLASQKVLLKIGMQFIGEEMEDDCPVRVFRKGNESNMKDLT
jgi:RimJ/RimL family protein N-acetyltransferase